MYNGAESQKEYMKKTLKNNHCANTNSYHNTTQHIFIHAPKMFTSVNILSLISYIWFLILYN